MKIVKLVCLVAIIGMIATSCDETKKVDADKDTDSTVEMTEESSDSDDMDAVETTSEHEGSTEAATPEESKDPAKSIDTASKDLEAVPVPEGVIAEEMADTPVVYPGCSGTVEEIRACSREKFIGFLKDEFNRELATDLGLSSGDHSIRTVVHIDETGKCSALRVSAPHSSLEKEMERVISKLPQLAPATKAGTPIGVTFILPLNFKVD